LAIERKSYLCLSQSFGGGDWRKKKESREESVSRSKKSLYKEEKKKHPKIGVSAK